LITSCKINDSYSYVMRHPPPRQFFNTNSRVIAKILAESKPERVPDMAPLTILEIIRSKRSFTIMASGATGRVNRCEVHLRGRLGDLPACSS